MLNTTFGDDKNYIYKDDYYIVDEYGFCTLTENFFNILYYDKWGEKPFPNIPKEATNLYNLFSGLDFLSYADLSAFDTSNVIGISNLFEDCYSLITVNISNFDFTKIKSMSFAFANCISLESIYFPHNFNADNLKTTEGLFFNCVKLKNTFNLCQMKTKSLLITSKMFCNCNSIEGINLYNLDTTNVLNASKMFAYCYNLEELVVSDKFVFASAIDLSRIFFCCRALVNLQMVIYANNNLNLKDSFAGCESLIGDEIGLVGFNNFNNIDIANMFVFCNFEDDVKDFFRNALDYNFSTNHKFILK